MASADLLREARLRAGLTQAELGRAVGRSQSAIGRWESGRVQPSLETLRDLIRACRLELTFGLANYDDSYVPEINRLLDLEPAERIEDALARQRAFAPIRNAAVPAA
ncbi:MAG TPA: helix-turn-helix transcriptional regulator [Gaiellaceae bacterium]|nr:helix-turn-helix transcriptional regulator [Gaiellaceae bacterium]